MQSDENMTQTEQAVVTEQGAVAALQQQWSNQSKEFAAIEAVADYALAHAQTVVAAAGLSNAIGANGEMRELRVKIDYLKDSLAALEQEFEDKKGLLFPDNLKAIADAAAGLSAAKEKVQVAVLAHGKTVKSAGFVAKYVSGTRKWNADMMEGFALAHPEIRAAFSQGEPNVQISRAKNGAGDE